ncbi:MAG: Stp1/IreP family PP2C-type Ser/Thr phosphatase [Rugosibacter sp.]|jgi:protein phosphatase|nr:PPM family protein phosphatase [Rugosibacter sp.]
MQKNTALEIFAQTDTGRVRSNNEDAVWVNLSCGSVILADGMGGYNAGEVASRMVTEILGRQLEKADAKRAAQPALAAALSLTQAALKVGIAEANRAIFSAGQARPDYAGMGTTVVAGVFQGNFLTVAHVGDSRLYRWRNQHLEQITRDHSWLEEQIASGIMTREQALGSRNKNLVTRAVGVEQNVSPEIVRYEIADDDIYLFCSDGLNDMLHDQAIEATLRALSANLDLCGLQLIQSANESGGRDNVSVILVRVIPPKPTLFAYPMRWWRQLLDRV